MELTDKTREEMVQSATYLVSCLKDANDEDAYCHCLDLLYALHRCKLDNLAKIVELAEQIFKQTKDA